MNKILVIYEVISTYDICSYNNVLQTISDISVTLNKITNHFKLYNDILQKNPRLSDHDILLPIVQKYFKYLYGNGEREDFISRANNIKFKDTIFKESINNIKDNIEINSDVVNIDVAKIVKALELLKKFKTDSLFSDCFYIVNAKETVLNWFDRIKSIVDLQNISDFDSFIDQNKFIVQIRKLLGDANSQLIDQLLENDPITYQDFSEKIINNLIHTVFNNFPKKERDKILSNYFVEYKQFLNKQRKNYLVEGLHILRLYTNQPQKDMKSDRNWSGGNAIERLRSNTKLIRDTFPIIAATPKEVAKYIAAEKDLFDYVVFDEASQLLPGQALPSIYRAKKAIIIGGDPPPLLANVSPEEDDDSDFDNNEKSILDLAIALQTATTHYLKVHYRSASNILFEPSRKAIYEEYGIQPIFEAGETETIPISILDNLGQNDEKNFDLII